MNRRSVTVLLLLLAVPATAQIVARQGEPRVDPAKQFDSPMVLEIPAADLRDLPKGEIWTVPGIRDYRCEDVHLAFMRFRNAGGPKGTGRFDVESMAMVAASHDRFVTVRAEIFDGEKIVARATRMKIDAEEKKGKAFDLRLDLTPEALAAFSASQEPRLRLTVHVFANGATPWTPDETVQ